MYNDGEYFKHWSLFIDGPEKITISPFDFDGSFMAEIVRADPWDSKPMGASVHLCKIPTVNVPRLEQNANEISLSMRPGWSQEYAMDLLDQCVEEELFNLDGVYEELWYKQDGMGERPTKSTGTIGDSKT